MAVLALGGGAQPALAAEPPAPAPAPTPAPPPSVFQRVIFSGEYRARYNHFDRDVQPAPGPESAVNTMDHRLRLGAIFPIFDDVLLISRFTTQASRWGAFELPGSEGTPPFAPTLPPGTPQFSQQRWDFDKLSLYWTVDEDTHVFLGRGDTRYFDSDLTLATGRFNDDDVFFEALLVEHKLDKDTTLIASASPWILNTPLLNADPRGQVQIAGYVLQARRAFEGGHRLQLYLGGLDPQRPNPLFGPPFGNKAIVAANLRYDHKFNDDLSVFASGSLNLTQTDGITLRPISGTSEGDRAGFFGGVKAGNSDKLHGHQVEGYYVKTGPFASNLVSEFPSGVHQVRGLWSHQFRKSFWVRASAMRQVFDTLPPGVLKAESDTAFLDINHKF